MGLLRTASAKVNPFEVSPRPSLSVLGGKGLERATSDNHLLLGGFKAGREKRGLSGLGQEKSSSSVTTLPGQRPSIAPYSLQGSGGSSGRRISGRQVTVALACAHPAADHASTISGRVRSALPNDWQSSEAPSRSAAHLRLQHTLSAPLVKPVDWASFEGKTSVSGMAC